MTQATQEKLSDIPALLQKALNLQNAGNLIEAESLYHQVLAVDAQNPDALHLLGLMAIQIGMSAEALELIQGAITVKPDFHQAHRNIGILYLDLERYPEALEHLLLAQSMRTNDLELYVYIADALKGVGKWEEAIVCYRQAINGGIDNPSEIHAQIGRLQLSNGEISQACDAFLQAWQLDHGNADALFGLALADAGRLQDEHIRSVIDLMEEEELDEEQSRTFNFILGNYYNKQGEYDWAFEYYDNGNKSRQINYDVSHIGKKIDEFIQVFDQSLFDRVGLAGSNSETPIFVLGLPRSGTTLVEQILASHSMVHGAGEIKALGAAIDKSMKTAGVTYPGGMVSVDNATLQSIADDYLFLLRESSGDAQRVVDKRPGNFAHIGLIRLALPSAKIVLCQRDLRDVAISNYFLDFGERQPWTHDLASMGEYIKHYRRLVSHWQSLLGEQLYLLQYEDLVNDIENGTRRLLDACGLEWEAQCLKYYEKTGAVHTASVSQVRQPVYTSSVGRWRHYRKHLQSFFSASGLDDDVNKFWY